jgi:hypothetical protein
VKAAGSRAAVLAELGPSAVSTVRNPCAIGTKYDFPKEHR